MRASILDQPVITVVNSNVEKVDRYDGDDLPVRTVDIVYRKHGVDNRDVGLDEADPVVREGRLRGAVDGLLRLRTEFVHHCDVPLQKMSLRRHEGSIIGEQGCPGFGILLNKLLGKAVSQRANGCFVSRLGRTRKAGSSHDERTCEKR